MRVFQGDQTLTLDWGFDPDAVRATEELVRPPFRFEGYNLYQFASAGTDRTRAVKIATYDAVNGVTAIWGGPQTESPERRSSVRCRRAPIQACSGSPASTATR